MSLIITEENCFYPDPHQYSHPSRWGLECEGLAIPGPEGLSLTGWHIPPHPEAKPKGKTVLHLHGNAQNMTAHLFASYFLAELGFRLITFDYRGYGRSQGRPTLAGILDDGAAAVEYLLTHPPAPDEPLALFGQSMGAFTAAHLIARFPDLDRAVLEAGLISFRDLFREAYPQADVRVPDGFSTLEPLGRSPVPKLFIHGTSDAVVPDSHSRTMHRSAAPPKDILILEGVGHIDALDSPRAGRYIQAVDGFLSA